MDSNPIRRAPAEKRSARTDTFAEIRGVLPYPPVGMGPIPTGASAEMRFARMKKSAMDSVSIWSARSDSECPGKKSAISSL